MKSENAWAFYLLKWALASLSSYRNKTADALLFFITCSTEPQPIWTATPMKSANALAIYNYLLKWAPAHLNSYPNEIANCISLLQLPAQMGPSPVEGLSQ